jgi:cytochrome b561
MSFFGLQLPPPFAPFSKDAHRFVGEAHYWVGWAIILVAFGHALAALFHHFALRDDVLWRMLPGERARRETERAPIPERAAGLR